MLLELAVAKQRPEKFRPEQDFEPCLLRCWCMLSGQLGAGHYVQGL